MEIDFSNLTSEKITDFHCLETFCSGVEALATSEYSAVGFYERCGFTANEVRKPYKDTLRMFRTLYADDAEYGEE